MEQKSGGIIIMNYIKKDIFGIENVVDVVDVAV